MTVKYRPRKDHHNLRRPGQEGRESARGRLSLFLFAAYRVAI